MESNYTARTSQRPRKRTREKFWKTHLEAQKESGLTQAEYCRRTNLNKNTFAWWRKKFRSRQNTRVDLIPVALTIPFPHAAHQQQSIFSGLTVVAGDGHRIEVDEHFQPAVLTQLLQLLGRS